MKIMKLILLLLAVPFLTNCIAHVPLSQQFYTNKKKVGVILKVNDISLSKQGAQGFLDMALTPGNRFTVPLKQLEKQFNLQETLQNEVVNLLKSQNKDFVFIPEPKDIKKFRPREEEETEKKFSKKDFRRLKVHHHDIDEVLYLQMSYGMLVSYYGFIEIGKGTFSYLYTEVVDISDNSLLQRTEIRSVDQIKGNWKKGENYPKLRNSLQASIDKSLAKFKTKF